MSKRTAPWLLGLVVVAACAATVAAWSHRSAEPRFTYATRQLSTGKKHISVEIADTEKKQELGLGQRDTLADGHGMLFTYDHASDLCFWMKDMRFPIDMVWLDSGKRVVRVASRVAVDSYPDTYCAPAGKPAQYVLEVGAGQAAAAGILGGSQLAF